MLLKGIAAVVCRSYADALKKAGEAVKAVVDITVYSDCFLEEGREELTKLYQVMSESDLLFLYRSAEEGAWSELETILATADKPVVWSGYDPAYWPMSTVPPNIPRKCYAYIMQGGEENFKQMFLMLAADVLQLNITYTEPKEFPGKGIYHPAARKIFVATEDYFFWYHKQQAGFATNPTVGLLFSRCHWVSGNTAVEDSVIYTLESKGINVIPVFYRLPATAGPGTQETGEIIRNYFMPEGKPVISALLKMMVLDRMDNRTAISGQEITLTELGIPVIQPVAFNFSRDITWIITMPEFAGVIEPLQSGGFIRESGGELRLPAEERVNKLADGVRRWIRLQRKPAAERRVAFILHDSAAVEATTVGGGAQLGSLESVSHILHAMKMAGYTVEPPAGGKEVLETIMAGKASAVYMGVQPRWGWSGSPCDGQVCQILYDPDIPPPHQYMATYKYLEKQVDVIVHIGARDNPPLLPEKMSRNGYSDVAIGAIPHLYIYNYCFY